MRLVAAREVRERVRSRFFQVSTAIAVLITLGAIVVPSMDRSPLRSIVRLGVVDGTLDELRATVERVRPLTGGTVELVALPDRAAAVRALREDRIHLAVVGSSEILSRRPVRPGDGSAKARLATALSMGPAITGTPVPLASLEPAQPGRTSKLVTAFIGTALIYGFVFVYGTTILNGVAEEKTSRVVEVLLSAVRPRELLTGKLLGIGAVALLQGTIIVSSAVLGTIATGGSPGRGASLGDALQMFGWFLLAYAFYSSAYAAAGSTVTRQEEAQNLAFPVGLPIIIAYAAASSALGGEDSRLLRILSFLPPTAPIAMPVRVSLGVVSGVQVAGAIAATALSTVGVVALAARVYSRSILRSGKRLRLRQLVSGA